MREVLYLEDLKAGPRFVYEAHQTELTVIADEKKRLGPLCEWNVRRRARKVGSDVFVQESWARVQKLCVHGWICALSDGVVNDLDATARDV